MENSGKLNCNFNLTQDQIVALASINSFLESEKHIFVLKGYAGTGKTTVIKYLVNNLLLKGISPLLMAPTGRSAKIMQRKTGYLTTTVHRGIYALDEIETKNDDSEDFAEREFKYIYPIRFDNSKKLLIIDEASMISSRKSEQELFSFGTNILIDDIFSFSKLDLGSKIIFVGDIAQLPPIGDNKSNALDVIFLQERGWIIDSFEMTQVVRQKENNCILRNATNIRDVLADKNRSQLIFEQQYGVFESIGVDEVVSSYCEKYPIPTIDKDVIICYTNKQASIYNKEVRAILFPSNSHITSGDIAVIVHNNYQKGVDLLNGDMAKVLDVSYEVEERRIPIYNEKKEKIFIELKFRDVVLLHESGERISTKIIDSLLDNEFPNLTTYEIKALYIDFCIRNPNLKSKDTGFKNLLKSDPYINALRIKYGYAITCHKAQGGEWETAFVDYSGRSGLNDDCLRWIYTATTRCSKTLYGANIPMITSFDKLSFSEIGQITNISQDAVNWGEMPETPFHDSSTHLCKRAKYWEIQNKLKNTKYSIARIKSNPYMEEYYINTGCEILRFDSQHNGAGIFKPYICRSESIDAEQVLQLLNMDYFNNFKALRYLPSNASFDRLYQLITINCRELNIEITNIVEYLENFYVTYYLKTSGKFSYIQFYYTKTGNLTQAIPKSDLGINDEKLKLLINQIS